MPVPGRLPRIVRETAQPLTVDGQVIPPGVSVCKELKVGARC